MEDDIFKSFREIYGTIKALQAKLKHAERYFVARSPLEKSRLGIRLLAPIELLYPDDTGTIHLRVIPIHEHTLGSEFMTVSYTWSQQHKLAEAFRGLTPKYMVHRINEEPQASRCSSLLLHRAF